MGKGKGKFLISRYLRFLGQPTSFVSLLHMYDYMFSHEMRLLKVALPCSVPRLGQAACKRTILINVKRSEFTQAR